MGAFVDDSADFFEHGAEVLAAVGAEGSGEEAEAIAGEADAAA